MCLIKSSLWKRRTYSHSTRLRGLGSWGQGLPRAQGSPQRWGHIPGRGHDSAKDPDGESISKKCFKYTLRRRRKKKKRWSVLNSSWAKNMGKFQVMSNRKISQSRKRTGLQRCYQKWLTWSILTKHTLSPNSTPTDKTSKFLKTVAKKIFIVNIA